MEQVVVQTFVISDVIINDFTHPMDRLSYNSHLMERIRTAVF